MAFLQKKRLSEGLFVLSFYWIIRIHSPSAAALDRVMSPSETGRTLSVQPPHSCPASRHKGDPVDTRWRPVHMDRHCTVALCRWWETELSHWQSDQTRRSLNWAVVAVPFACVERGTPSPQSLWTVCRTMRLVTLEQGEYADPGHALCAGLHIVFVWTQWRSARDSGSQCQDYFTTSMRH